MGRINNGTDFDQSGHWCACGVAAGKSSPTFDLGMIGNIIAGLVRGGVLGQIVTLMLPSVVAAAQSGNLTVGALFHK
jgi:hypothetical protein